MSTPPPLPSSRRPSRRERKPFRPQVLAGYLAFLAVASGPIVFWFGFRIEPGEGQIVVLTRKTGENLPSGQIIAQNPGQQGIQLDLLSEGRYFRNPFHWDWEIHTITDIPAGKLGVQTRLFGEDLPQGRIIATEGSKGILTEVLMPGKHRVNPYAYHVELFDAITVRAGHVGVITSLVGADVLSSPEQPGHTNSFLVVEGSKGVVAQVKDPGTYYLNPYLLSLVEVNLQGQRFEMSGPDAISFLTQDGFTVLVEGTIEFAIQRDRAAYLTHRVGDMDDIIKKIIMPRARGFSRIEGSKHPAINFIVGQTRQGFQNDLEAHLRARSLDWGVDIRSVLVRKIQPPDQIAAINRDREVAVQEAAKYDQQIQQARSKAELVKQEMLAVQNKEKVEADTERIRSLIAAQQSQSVRVIDAGKDLEVTRVKLEAAKFEAEAVLLKADGERDAVRADNEAQARVFGAEVAAMGGGMNLARLNFYRKMAPALQSVLGNDGAEGVGSLFRAYLVPAKEVE
jgi:regulator of protease activity HflC (stomatin/prohibitin superfamily)